MMGWKEVTRRKKKKDREDNEISAAEL